MVCHIVLALWVDWHGSTQNFETMMREGERTERGNRREGGRGGEKEGRERERVTEGKERERERAFEPTLVHPFYIVF